MTISNEEPVAYERTDYYPTTTSQDIIATAAALIVMEEAEKRHGGENGQTWYPWTVIS